MININNEKYKTVPLTEGGILFYKMKMRKYLIYKSMTNSIDNIDPYYVLLAFNSLYSVKLLVKLMVNSSAAQLITKDNKRDILKQLIDPNMATIKDIIAERRNAKSKRTT